MGIKFYELLITYNCLSPCPSASVLLWEYKLVCSEVTNYLPLTFFLELSLPELSFFLSLSLSSSSSSSLFTSVSFLGCSFGASRTLSGLRVVSRFFFTSVLLGGADFDGSTLELLCGVVLITGLRSVLLEESLFTFAGVFTSTLDGVALRDSLDLMRASELVLCSTSLLCFISVTAEPRVSIERERIAEGDCLVVFAKTLLTLSLDL